MLDDDAGHGATDAAATRDEGECKRGGRRALVGATERGEIVRGRVFDYAGVHGKFLRGDEPMASALVQELRGLSV